MRKAAHASARKEVERLLCGQTRVANPFLKLLHASTFQQATSSSHPRMLPLPSPARTTFPTKQSHEQLALHHVNHGVVLLSGGIVAAVAQLNQELQRS